MPQIEVFFPGLKTISDVEKKISLTLICLSKGGPLHCSDNFYTRLAGSWLFYTPELIQYFYVSGGADWTQGLTLAYQVIYHWPESPVLLHQKAPLQKFRRVKEYKGSTSWFSPLPFGPGIIPEAVCIMAIPFNTECRWAGAIP